MRWKRGIPGEGLSLPFRPQPGDQRSPGRAAAAGRPRRRHARGRSTEAPPWTVGLAGASGLLAAADSWQTQGPSGGSVLSPRVRDPGSFQGEIRSSSPAPELLPSPAMPLCCLFKRSAGRSAS